MPNESNKVTTNSLKLNAQWLKNAARTLGMNSISTIADISPNMAGAGRAVASSISTVSSAASSVRRQQHPIQYLLESNKYVKLGKRAIDNALSDLAKGKFSNQERASGAISNEMGGTSTGTYFGDMSDGSSGEDNSGQTVQNIYNVDTKAIDNVSNAVNTQTKYQLQMGKANIDTMVAIASSSMTQSQKNSDAILTQVTEMNRGVQALVAYQNENMTKFISASMAYYDAAGKSLGSGNGSSIAPTKRSIINENGGLNVDAYLDRAKKQFSKEFRGSTMGLALQMLSEGAEDFANNPLEFVSKTVMEKAIPEVTKKALKATDQVFGSFMSEMLLQMGDSWSADTSDTVLGSIKRFAAKAFGINDKRSTKINRSGKVSTEAAVFDGVTRSAIIDELPKYARESTSYLREMVKLLGGDPNSALRGSRILNRETGRYQSMESFATDFASSIDNQVIAAMDKSSFGKEMRNMATRMGKNDDQIKTLNDAIDKFFIAAERNEKGAIDLKDLSEGSEMSELIKSAGLDPKMQRFIKETIAGMLRNRTGFESFNESRNRARRSRNLRIDEISADTGMLRTSNLFRSGNSEDEIDVSQVTAESLLPQKRGKGGIKLPATQGGGLGAAVADALYGNSSAKLIGGANPRNMAMGSVGSRLKTIEDILIRGINVRIDNNPPWQGAQDIGGSSARGYSEPIGPEPAPGQRESTATPSSSVDIDLSDIENVADEEMKQASAPTSGRGSKIANTLGHAKQAMYLMMTGNASLAMNEMSTMLGETMSSVAGAAKKHILDPLRDAILPTKEVTDENGNVHTEKVTVLDMVKEKFSSITTSMKETILGKDKDGNPKSITSVFKEGIGEWRKTFFGDKDPEEIKQEIQKRVPDAVGGAMGGGLIGMLVGGPFVGALVGGAAGFAKKSKWFQDMIFGEVENGKEIKKGLIPPSVREYYNENKKELTGGAAVGGLLGLVVGGPVLGAAAGIGATMLKKSDKFNELLFGKEEKDEKTGAIKKVGGVLNLFKEVTGHYVKGTSDDTKGLSAKAAVGVGGGLLLSLFTPLGPIGGAAAGLAASIATNGDKFRQFLFGKKDKDGNLEEAGLFQKMGNNITAQVINPLRDGVLDFFDKSKDKVIDKMLSPMLAALQPLLNFGGRIYEKTLGKIAAGAQAAGDAFGNLLKKVGRGLWNRTLGRAGKFVKGVASGVVSAATGTVGGAFKAAGKFAEKRNRKASLKRFNREDHTELIKEWTDKYNSDPRLQNKSLEEYLDDMKSRHYYNYGDKLKNYFGTDEERETARQATKERIANRKELRKQSLLISELTGGKYSDTGATAKQAALEAYMQSKRYAKGKGLNIKHYGKMSQEDILTALRVDDSESRAISSAQTMMMDEQLQAQREAAGTLGKIYEALSTFKRKLTGEDDPERQEKRSQRQAAKSKKAAEKQERKEKARQESARRAADYENALNETARSTESTYGARRDAKLLSIADRWKDAEREITKGLKSKNPTIRKAAKDAYPAFFDEDGDRIVGHDISELIPIEAAKKKAYAIFNETAHSRKANATQAGMVGRLRSLIHTENFVNSPRANGMPHRANGGLTEEGYTVVGERGPEVVQFPDKARVLSGKSKIDVNIIGIDKNAVSAISEASDNGSFSGSVSKSNKKNASNIFKEFLQKSSEDSKNDAFTTSAMSAASNLVATGGVASKEADEYKKLVDDASDPDTAKGKIKARLTKILGHSQEKTDDDNKQSFVSKIINTVKNGFSSLIGNLGFGGLATAVAGLVGVSDLKSLWDNVISKDGDMTFKEWFGEKSTIGKAIGQIPVIWEGVKNVSTALGGVAGKFNGFVQPFAQKVVDLVPGLNIQLPGDMSNIGGPLGGVANIAVAGLYAKAVGAAGSVANAIINAGKGAIDIFRDLIPRKGPKSGGGGMNPMNLVYGASTALGSVGLMDSLLYMTNQNYQNASDAKAVQSMGGTSEMNEVTGKQDNIISAEQHAEDKRNEFAAATRKTAATLPRDVLRTHGLMLGTNLASRGVGAIAGNLANASNIPGRFLTALMSKSVGESTFREAWKATAGMAMQNPVGTAASKVASGANVMERLSNSLFHAPKGGAKVNAKAALKGIFNKNALKSGLVGIAGGIAGTAGSSWGWEKAETAKHGNFVGDYGLGNAGGYSRTGEKAKSITTGIMGLAGGLAATAAWNAWHPGGWILAIIAGITLIAAAFSWVVNHIVGWVGDAKDREYAIRTNTSKFRKVISDGIAYVDGEDNPMYVYCPQESDRVCGLTEGKFVKDPELMFGQFLRALMEGTKSSPGAEVLLYDLINNLAVQGVPFACAVAGSSNECKAKGNHANKNSLGDCPPSDGKNAFVSSSKVKKNLDAVYQDIQENIGRQDDSAVFGPEDVEAVYEAGKEVVKKLKSRGILNDKGKVNFYMFNNVPGSKKNADGWAILEKLGRSQGTYFITKCLVYINSKIEANKEGKQWIELKESYIETMMENLSDVADKEHDELAEQMRKEGKSEEEIKEALESSPTDKAQESAAPETPTKEIYQSVSKTDIREKDKYDVSKELQYLTAAYIFAHPDKLQNWANTIGTASGITKDNLGNNNIKNWKSISDKRKKNMLLNEMASASMAFASTHGDIFDILPNFDWSKDGKIYTGNSKDPGEKYGSAFVIRGNTTAEKSPLGSLFESGKVGSETDPKEIHDKLFGNREHEKGAEADSIKSKGGKNSILGKIAQRIVKYGSDIGVEKTKGSEGKNWQKVLYWLPASYPKNIDSEENLETLVSGKAKVSIDPDAADALRNAKSGRDKRGGKGGRGNIIPFYSQKDPRWAGRPYDTNNTETMYDAGCGPTALSMAVSGAGGTGPNPMDAANRLQAIGARDNTGTSWAGMNKGIGSYGLNSDQTSNPGQNFVDVGISSGKPVILSGTSMDSDDPFTSQGHYVVVTGKDRNGNYIVNDPNESAPVIYSKEQVTRNAAKGWRVSGGRGQLRVIRGGGSAVLNTSVYGGAASADQLASTKQRWINTIKAVKKAISDQKPGYSQTNWISITIGGKTLKVRTDCSGFVAACLKYMGMISDTQNLTSYSFADKANSVMLATGFKPSSWPGWNSLEPGDIIARNGHVEIFASNDGNGSKHYVWNCGSDSSVNNPDPTVTGHDAGYSTVWRIGEACSGGITDFDVSSTSGTTASFTGTTGTEQPSFISKLMSWGSELSSRALGFITGSMSLGDATDWTSWKNGETTNSSGTSSYSGYDGPTAVPAANIDTSSSKESIYRRLITEGRFTPEGAAGLMGNLHAESGVRTNNVQNSTESRVGSDTVYTQKVDDGSYSLDQFANDEAGYGLAQWTSSGRKAGLYKLAKDKQKSIADEDVQVTHLLNELNTSYSKIANVLKTTKDVGEASYLVMHDFEAPKSRDSIETKKTRESLARGYYEKFKDLSLSGNAGGKGGTATPYRGQWKYSTSASPIHGTSSVRGETTRGSSAPINFTEHKIVQMPQKSGGRGLDDRAIRLLEQIVQILGTSDSKLNNLKYLSDIASFGGNTTNNFATIHSANSTTSNRNLRNQEVEKMSSEAYADAKRIVAG